MPDSKIPYKALDSTIDLYWENDDVQNMKTEVPTEENKDIRQNDTWGAKFTFTVNKNDIVKNRDIYVGSILQENPQENAYFTMGVRARYFMDINWQGKKIGELIADNIDNSGEAAFYFHVTDDNFNFSTDPKLTANIGWVIDYHDSGVEQWTPFHNLLSHNPYIIKIITPNKTYIKKYDTSDLSKEINTLYQFNNTWQPGVIGPWQGPWIKNGQSRTMLNAPFFATNENVLSADQAQDIWQKISSGQNVAVHPLQIGWSVWGSNIALNPYTGLSEYIPVMDQNNKPISQMLLINHNMIHMTKEPDNLSIDQLRRVAHQSDKTGSYYSYQNGTDKWNEYTYYKPEDSTISDEEIKNSLAKYNALYSMSTPENQAKIIQNTLIFYHKQLHSTPLFSTISTIILPANNLLPAIANTQGTVSPLNTIKTNIYGPDNSSFNAELYRYAQVHYLDSSNKDTPVSNDSIMGTKNNAANYTLNIPKGYILDTKSGKNKDATQYKWSADKKSIVYTFSDDQTLNNNNPINIYITHGTHNTNDNSGKSTRTIQYTGLPDNLKPKDNVQTVLFKRSGVTDDVTGETTYGDWQPQSGNGHYTAVTSPTFAGYKPDQAVVPDEAATPNKNENVTVNYSRTNQHAKLTVHDDTANTDLNDYAENSTGLYQDQINFKTAPSAVEQELKDKGYNIVSDSFKGSPTYNADDSKNNFVIHVTHKIVPVTPDQPKTPTDVIPDTKQHYPTGVDTNDLNKDVQRSIFYKYEDNTQAEPTVVQKAHFGRTVKVDAVTQKIVDNGTWATKDNYPEVATKSIDGYTPDKTKVNSATPSMTTNQDQTVVYHANDEDAAITYIDDTTGKVLKTDTQKAKYKQTIKFATDPNTQIQTYKDQGYVLVSSDWKDGSTYQTDPTKNKFTVHLKHGTSTVTPDKPKKSTDIIPGTKQHYPTGVDANDLNQPQQRQITYTYSDSKKQASPTVTQKVTFHRTATVDNVTGKTTYTDWTTSDQYPEVKSPTIEGYTPDKSNVPVTKPVLNTKQDVAVIYNPNPEQVDVIAQDNTGKQLSKSTLHGNYNTDYSATTPVIKGYHLIKMPVNTHGTYKIHNDPIIYIYAPDSNSVPEQTDGTPKPDKSSYPNDLTPAKRSNKLPETGSINLQSEINSVTNNITHTLSHLLH